MNNKLFSTLALLLISASGTIAQSVQRGIVVGDANVKTVNGSDVNNGDITTANENSTVTITVTPPAEGKVARVTVSAATITATSVSSITPSATSVNVNSTITLTATVTPSYANTVYWTVSNDTKAKFVSGSTTVSTLTTDVNAATGQATATLKGLAAGEVTVSIKATSDASTALNTQNVTVVKPIPAGAIRGKFTINAGGEQVYFSQGNLQATTADNGTTWTWGFAENQWDFVGNAAANNAINGNGTVSTNGTVDLFGWSTAATTYGIHNSTTAGNYSGDFKDWGENIGTGWRTLTKDEWNYLFMTRESGSKVNGMSPSPDNARYTHATINTDNETGGIRGMILFPDGVTINSSDATYWGGINQNSNWNGSTKCTTSQWNALAAKGFVFLPTAGSRNGTTINYSNDNGYYWSSYTASSNNNNAHYTRVVASNEPTTGYDSRKCGFAVRLVKNVVGSISYTTTSVNKEFNAVPFSNPLTNTGDGTVTYARSDGDNICTVNETTGEVTLNGTLGTCIITATVADGSIYSYPTNTASYTLTVIDSTTPTGAIRGKFTVASGTQVYFSQGNLQAVFASAGSSCTWKFADNQWDVVGNSAANTSINGNGSVSAAGTVDLFGWSTAATTYGIHNSTTDSDYSGDFVDWGTLAITNGGNTENSGWRTLTIDEWTWLLGLINGSDPNPGTNCRTSSTIGTTVNARFAKAKLFTTHGLIIFPDSYTHPDDVDAPTGINETGGTSWNANTYNATDWGKMEAAGCVFLPVAGRRWGTGIEYVDPSDNAHVYYWSATHAGSSIAYPMRFGEGTGDIGTNAYVDRNMGNVVRLVYPVPTE